MSLFYLSSYFNVTVNKLWCLLLVCGLESGSGGGWWDAVFGWVGYTGSWSVTVFEEMWTE